MEEGWLYGLFALLGVLIGGIFSFLGIKKQLKQQREADSRQWRRNIRSEPLLKLRDDLAIMASELDILIATSQAQSQQQFAKDSDKYIKLQQIYDKWEKYRTSGDFLKTLHLQYDVDLLKAVNTIKGDYLLLFEYALDYGQLKKDERKSFRELSEKISKAMPFAQEQICKRLEGL